MSYCEMCGTKLRDSGRCGNCEKEAVIYYEQSVFTLEGFSYDFVQKAQDQEKNRMERIKEKNNDKYY